MRAVMTMIKTDVLSYCCTRVKQIIMQISIPFRSTRPMFGNPRRLIIFLIARLLASSLLEVAIESFLTPCPLSSAPRLECRDGIRAHQPSGKTSKQSGRLSEYCEVHTIVSHGEREGERERKSHLRVRCRPDKAIDAIENPTVFGDEVTKIFQSSVTFEHRGCQITNQTQNP